MLNTNTVDFNSPLPGIHNVISRCLIDLVMEKVRDYRFISIGDGSIHAYKSTGFNRLGSHIATIKFVDDEIQLYSFNPYTVGVPARRENAVMTYNLSDPTNSIESLAVVIANLLKVCQDNK